MPVPERGWHLSRGHLSRGANAREMPFILPRASAGLGRRGASSFRGPDRNQIWFFGCWLFQEFLNSW
jgi:hypothetical protein